MVAKKERKNTPETQKLIDHLTKENSRPEEGHTIPMEQLKAQAVLQTMIVKLVMEKKDLKEQLYAQNENPESTTEMEKRIQKLEKENDQLKRQLLQLLAIKEKT